ncbi:hypothetical protein P3T24_007460 [Paraburkholderia sp. GAS33]
MILSVCFIFPLAIICMISMPLRMTLAAEVLEPDFRSVDAFDRPMVLLNHVIQILDLTNLGGRVAPSVHHAQRGQVGSAFVDRHRLGYAVLLERFLEKNWSVALLRLVRRRKSMCCLPCPRPDRGNPIHAGFVHPLDLANWPIAAAEHRLKHRQKLDGPAVHHGVIDRSPTLRHHFVATRAKRIGNVPTHAATSVGSSLRCFKSVRRLPRPLWAAAR